jgi:four helix bundle protein
MENGEIKNFFDLKTWKDAHHITLEVYILTKEFPKDEQFGLVSQMRRAAASIGANIAEGFGRFHFKEKIKFYQQARGSLIELQNHFILAVDLGYIDKNKKEMLLEKTNTITQEINGLIKSINIQIDK